MKAGRYVKTYRKKSKIHTHEDKVAFPLEISNQCWPNHGNEEIPEPIRRDSDGVAV